MTRWLIILLTLAVAGCTTYKLWNETDSDEQAGMIQLSYEYRRFENPQVDERGGNAKARRTPASAARRRTARSGASRANTAA
jgi:hypothetical protein